MPEHLSWFIAQLTRMEEGELALARRNSPPMLRCYPGPERPLVERLAGVGLPACRRVAVVPDR